MTYIDLPREIQTHITSFIPLEIASSFTCASKLCNEIVNDVVQKNLDQEFLKLPKDHFILTKREFQVLPKSHLLSFVLAEETSPGNAETFLVNHRSKVLRETSKIFREIENITKTKKTNNHKFLKLIVLDDVNYSEFQGKLLFELLTYKLDPLTAFSKEEKRLEAQLAAIQKMPAPPQKEPKSKCIIS